MGQQRIGRIQWGPLTFGPGSPYMVTAIDGVDDMPEIRAEDIPRPDQHGDYTGPDTTGARVIQLGLGLRADSPDELRKLTLALRAATQPQRQPAPLQFLDWDTLVYGKVRKRNIPYDAEYLWRTGTAALEVYCADPYLYSLNEYSASTTAYSPAAGRTYPLVYSGAGPAARNLVLNPSFEETFTGETTGFGTNSTRSRVSAESYVGGYSVQHAISVASAQGGTSWNIEPVASGQTVQFGVWVKVPTTGIAALELWWRNQTTTLSTTSVIAQAKPGSWARVFGSYTVAMRPDGRPSVRSCHHLGSRRRHLVGRRRHGRDGQRPSRLLRRGHRRHLGRRPERLRLRTARRYRPCLRRRRTVRPPHRHQQRCQSGVPGPPHRRPRC